MNIRRLGALSLACVIGGTALSGGVADAQTKESLFNANAQATALHLNLLGTDLTLSNVTAGLDSQPSVVATATEILTPAFTAEGVEVSRNSEQGTSTDSIEECTFGPLEQIPGLARIHDATCPSVLARIDDVEQEIAFAQGLGTELKVDVSVSEILDTLQLREPIAGTHDDDANDGVDDQVIDTVGEVLAPLSEALTGTPFENLIDDTVVSVDNLVEDVLGLDTTVRLAVAPAVAETESTVNEVRAFAKAQALRIELLPVNDLGEFNGIINDLGLDQPLLTIIISEAWGEQVYQRGAAAPEPAVGDSAVAKIIIGPGLPLLDDQVLPLLDTLGLADILAQVTGGVNQIPGLENAAVSLTNGNRELTIKGPGEFTLLEGTPLETTLVLSAVDLSNGFSATGVKLHALKGVNGGLLASLSDVAGGGVGEPRVLSAPVVEVPKELARTGATPWVPLVGMAMLALAVGSRRILVARAER